MNDELFDAVVELNEKDALRIVREKVESGENPLAIIELCRKALTVVGDRYAKREYFLSELVMAAEIFREIMEIIEPIMHGQAESEKKVGRVVIGTVKGDVHNIGKNIVISMLKINNFDVYDLGVDVPPEYFVKEIEKVNPEIVGMSCLLTVGLESMKATVEAIKKAGLRDKVKIIIGGGMVNEDVAKYVGADAYVKDVSKGIDICKRWMKELDHERRRGENL